MTVNPAVEVLGVYQMVGIRVVLLEDLGAEQEQVQEHRIRHQFGHLPDGRVLDLEQRLGAHQLGIRELELRVQGGHRGLGRGETFLEDLLGGLPDIVTLADPKQALEMAREILSR